MVGREFGGKSGRIEKYSVLVAGGVENRPQGILGVLKWQIWGILSEFVKFFQKRVETLRQ